MLRHLLLAALAAIFAQASTGGRLSTPFGLRRRSSAGAQLVVAQQRTAEEAAEEAAMIRAKLTEIFKKYDKNKDGYLTMEEYNQWCRENSRGIRQITTEIRYRAFCKYIKSDPNKGISLEGLIYLYGKPEQQGSFNSLLLGNGLLLASALLVCIALSVPYYLPSCTEYCRTFP